MKPPQKEFERVPTDDFVNAEIVDIEYDEQHEFTVRGEKHVAFGVRVVFEIAGLENKKKSRWFTFSYDERSNIYKLFLAPLVENAEPYMEFDLDQLKGMKIKMLWKDDKDPRYQSIETIRPVGKKVVSDTPQTPKPIFDSSLAETHEDEELV